MYLLSCHGKWSIEPLLKGVAGFEYGWQQEVKKCPQLRKIILDNAQP